MRVKLLIQRLDWICSEETKEKKKKAKFIKENLFFFFSYDILIYHLLNIK